MWNIYGTPLRNTLSRYTSTCYRNARRWSLNQALSSELHSGLGLSRNELALEAPLGRHVQPLFSQYFSTVLGSNRPASASGVLGSLDALPSLSSLQVDGGPLKAHSFPGVCHFQKGACWQLVSLSCRRVHSINLTQSEGSARDISAATETSHDALLEAVSPPPSHGTHAHGSAVVPYSEVDLPLDAVVKVFTVASSPNYFLPWQNKPQREITGSGFVIAGKRIVTNAHVVADHTFVLVRKHGSPVKYRATVEAVGHECDLALLRIEDETFWEGLIPLELGGIPQLQEEVAVVGYPQGGDNISVTGGVVSRVELTQYVHGASHLIAIQIDAAINPGNSGGPALLHDKVAGVAFQNLPNAENIGYIIPVPVIQHFLNDVKERQRYVGFCSLGLTCQALENAQLRSHFRLPAGSTGVLVNRVQPLSSASKVLKKDDVLLAFDGVPIANDGSVQLRKRERIAFDYLVSMKKAGEAGRVKVLRKGKEKEFEVKLGPLPPLVPIHQFDRLPSYFIFAGLVFAPLTQPYLHEYGEDWYNASPRRLCDRALREIPTRRGQQLVILSQILMDDINAGYERLAELQVKQVNGVEVHNLRHLQHLVATCHLDSIRFDFDDDRVAVLNRQAAVEASFQILQRYRIPLAMSEDLKVPARGAEVQSNFQALTEEDSSKEWWETHHSVAEKGTGSEN